MLTRAQVGEVERLLAAGRSARSIAGKLELDRRTIGKVARGEHPLQRGRSAPQAHGQARLVPVRGVEAQAQQLRDFLTDGGRLSRRQVKRFLRAAAKVIADNPLGLGLRGEVRERYERVARDRRELESRLGNEGRKTSVAFAPRDGVN